MASHDQLLPADALATGEAATSLSSRIKFIGTWLMIWVKACGDHWEAAALCDELSALSDAELARGLSRVALAQDVRTACDRSGDA